MEDLKGTAFLLILAASFLMILIYVTNPSLRKSVRDFGLSDFNRSFTVSAGGDVMLGRSVMSRSFKEKDFSYPFREIASELSQSDVTLVNLENPIIKDCPFTDEGFKFCVRPEMIEGLTLSGVDIVNLANNHTGNYGKEGIEETKKFLAENGIDWVGEGNLMVKEKRGIKYGFLGFDFVTNSPKETDFELIKFSKEKVNILFVAVHWGAEYTNKANSAQRLEASQIADAGADYILGSHPHWVQESEQIGDSVVYYSLGNLVFDQMWSEKTREGLVVSFTFKDGKLTKKEEKKTFMSSWAQPEWVK